MLITGMDTDMATGGIMVVVASAAGAAATVAAAAAAAADDDWTSSTRSPAAASPVIVGVVVHSDRLGRGLRRRAVPDDRGRSDRAGVEKRKHTLKMSTVANEVRAEGFDIGTRRPKPVRRRPIHTSRPPGQHS
jgi:hypothetical protein